MNFPARLAKLRQHLASRFNALLISHLPNIHYLCGFTGSAGLLLIQEDASVFFTDTRYDIQSHEEVKGAKIVIARNGALDALANFLAARRKRSRSTLDLGIESEHFTVSEKKRLRQALPSGIRIKDAPSLVERERMVKDDGELELIRAAVQLGATLFDRALEVIRPGVTEVEVAAEMELTARRNGAEAMSFPTIIASGARSALPHGRASAQPIPTNSFVVCDFGVILAGYCSDQTRTLWMGPESGEARFAYESVREAQAAAIQAVLPGATVGEVDEAARKVLRQAKLARYFTHSTGHGVGLEIHEAPRVASGVNTVLQPGMVITIEPGVYFPGRWGIRIEDMVTVTESGCEVLTPTSKEFLAV